MCLNFRLASHFLAYGSQKLRFNRQQFGGQRSNSHYIQEFFVAFDGILSNSMMASMLWLQRHGDI